MLRMAPLPPGEADCSRLPVVALVLGLEGLLGALEGLFDAGLGLAALEVAAGLEGAAGRRGALGLLEAVGARAALEGALLLESGALGRRAGGYIGRRLAGALAVAGAGLLERRAVRLGLRAIGDGEIGRA